MKIYTIGFTQKSAETFFGLLRTNHIQCLVDIRLRPDGQLSGFARRDDLPYFLRKLSSGCEYIHLPDLAPTKEILDDYRKDTDWLRYVTRFENLMDERQIPQTLDIQAFKNQTSCFLCSEATPEKCHRRLVAERLAAQWPGVEIIHL